MYPPLRSGGSEVAPLSWIFFERRAGQCPSSIAGMVAEPWAVWYIWRLPWGTPPAGRWPSHVAPEQVRKQRIPMPGPSGPGFCETPSTLLVDGTVCGPDLRRVTLTPTRSAAATPAGHGPGNADVTLNNSNSFCVTREWEVGLGLTPPPPPPLVSPPPGQGVIGGRCCLARRRIPASREWLPHSFPPPLQPRPPPGGIAGGASSPRQAMPAVRASPRSTRGEGPGGGRMCRG